MTVGNSELGIHTFARTQGSYKPVRFYAPLHNASSIVAATLITAAVGAPQVLPFVASGTASSNMSGDAGQMLIPCCPIVTSLDPLGNYTIIFVGYDQFGDGPFTEQFDKTSTLTTTNRFAMRAYSRFVSITVIPRNAAGAVDTMAVGFLYGQGANEQTRFALPFKSKKQFVSGANNTGDWSPHCICTTLGGATATAPVVAALTNINQNNANFIAPGGGASVEPNSSSEKSVISFTTNVTVANTLPMEFLIGMREASGYRTY